MAMSQVTGLPEFPFLASGVSPRLLGLLREAGVPVARFDQTSRGQLTGLPGRLMLFDSQTESGCDGFRTASRYGLPAIDVSKHVLALSRQNRSESRVFGNLKTEIERRGGLWGRLGDFPHPYRGVLCAGNTGRGRELEGFVESFELAAHRPEGLHSRYRQGLPAVVRGNASRMGAASELAEQLPLLWRTTLTEFATWWRARREVRISLKRDESTYYVTCENLPEAGRPVLELWRGGHIARIAIEAESTIIDKRGLVYTHETQRDPGGLSASWVTRWKPDQVDSGIRCVPA